MQIVTLNRKITMLALPVERLVGSTSTSGTSTTSRRLTSSPGSSSEESSCSSPRPAPSVKLFSPLNVGIKKTDRSPSPATNGRRDSDNEPTLQPPQSPQQQALSLVKEEKSESRQGGGLVLVSPPKLQVGEQESPSSASILERMTTSIKLMETHLERNPPAASLFSSHLHNNSTSDNESGGGSDHENNRPPSRPMSSASTSSTVASTALSPGSAAGFLHYHHYHYHFNNNNNNNNDGAKSPKSTTGTSTPTKANSTTSTTTSSAAASPSSRSSPTSSVNLKFSIADILKPEFGKGAITKKSGLKRPAVDTILHNSSNDRRNRSLLHSPSEPPPSKSPRTFGNSRASSVKDFSEDSNGSTCTTASGRRIGKEEVVDETKVNPALPEGPMVWPAWVYCTRYSDRPSSGPRSRRVRKPEPGQKREPTEEKRPRTAFTAEQLARLKQEFESNRYLTEKRRQDLAIDLKLHENQIKIWFQNKRAKLKKSNGARGELALHLMSQGLYNHSTVPIDEDEEYEALLAAQQQQGQVNLA